MQTSASPTWRVAKQGCVAIARELVLRYPRAFHVDYRPSYGKAEAEDGWKRCVAWFNTKGV
jgi:dienelactone hydrolase